MDIIELRSQIDNIDKDLVRLFLERMGVSAKIAEYKRQNGLPVLDPNREMQKLEAVAASVQEDMRGYVSELFQLLFRLSRAYQELLAEVM